MTGSWIDEALAWLPPGPRWAPCHFCGKPTMELVVGLWPICADCEDREMNP